MKKELKQSRQTEFVIEKNYDKLVKLLVIGDSAVGKTSLITRYVDDIFRESYINTVGIDFKTKIIKLQNNRIKLQLWDTAGHERFHTITAGYYRGAHGLLIVFDLTTPESFHNIQYWLRHIEDNCQKNLPKIIVGTKSDLYELKKVEMNQVAALCEELDLRYIQVSSKTGKNVEELFQTITGIILEKLQREKGSEQRAISLINDRVKNSGKGRHRCSC